MLVFNEVKKKYEIYPYKVNYKIRGVDATQYALPDKQWWIDTCGKHDHLELINFEDVVITEDMQTRFKEIDTFQYYDLAVKYIEGEELPTFITDFLLGKIDTIDQTKLDEYYEIS